jgi:hypothetical protein
MPQLSLKSSLKWTIVSPWPWAFVLSLTRWEARKFTGGETFIVKPEVLDYWRGFDAGAVVERGSLVELVEPRFNRMTVFDPRWGSTS